MQDWWREYQEGALLSPIFKLYGHFMDIKRYEHMPFYFYPAAKTWISWEDGVLTFLDYLVDAHEHERNQSDKNRCFYERA